MMRVDLDVLHKMLHLPDSVTITHAVQDYPDVQFGRVSLRLVGDRFPVIREGEKIPEFNAVFHRAQDGSTVFDRFEPVGL